MSASDLDSFVSVVDVITSFFSLGLNIAAYILTALGLYTIAKRRGISKPWLAWIPVADAWLLGSISDQYQYVVKGEVKSKRKLLLGLNIALWSFFVVFYVILFVALFQTLDLSMGRISDQAMASAILKILSSLLFAFIPMMAVSITTQVFYYIAVYDVYRSCDPEHSVLFLVLSILLNVTQPFFIFFSRNKDRGMPPRKAEPMRQIPPPNPQLPPQGNSYPPRQPYYPPQPNPYQPQRPNYPPQPNPYQPQQPYSPPQPYSNQNPQRSLNPDTAPKDSE